jgi:hypothetical protein
MGFTVDSFSKPYMQQFKAAFANNLVGGIPESFCTVKSVTDGTCMGQRLRRRRLVLQQKRKLVASGGLNMNVENYRVNVQTLAADMAARNISEFRTVGDMQTVIAEGLPTPAPTVGTVAPTMEPTSGLQGALDRNEDYDWEGGLGIWWNTPHHEDEVKAGLAEPTAAEQAALEEELEEEAAMVSCVTVAYQVQPITSASADEAVHDFSETVVEFTKAVATEMIELVRMARLDLVDQFGLQVLAPAVYHPARATASPTMALLDAGDDAAAAADGDAADGAVGDVAEGAADAGSDSAAGDTTPLGFVVHNVANRPTLAPTTAAPTLPPTPPPSAPADPTLAPSFTPTASPTQRPTNRRFQSQAISGTAIREEIDFGEDPLFNVGEGAQFAESEPGYRLIPTKYPTKVPTAPTAPPTAPPPLEASTVSPTPEPTAVPTVAVTGGCLREISDVCGDERGGYSECMQVCVVCVALHAGVCSVCSVACRCV